MKYALLLAIIFLTPLVIAAEISCPRDIINDPYPGLCGSYIDTNGDKICDYSEVIEKIDSKQENVEVENEYKGREYYLVYIGIVLLVLYIISFFLSRKKIISVVGHRKIWNLFLLISFLAVGLSGILLVLRITYGFSIQLPFNLLFWHVETGIVMALISVFHILWHLPYFKAMIKR